MDQIFLGAVNHLLCESERRDLWVILKTLASILSAMGMSVSTDHGSD